MCGFLFCFDRAGVGAQEFSAALDLLRHRGPDDEGLAEAAAPGDVPGYSLQGRGESPQLRFGHKRLSIVDLTSGSRQPCISTTQRTALLFNGEIYNYRDLSRSAATRGSDTLTLFEMLNAGGIDHLDNLNGMWAFCYYDADKRALYASRDRYGKKPLYYHLDSQRLILASEFKAIFSMLPNTRRQITTAGLTYYLLGKQTPFLNDGKSFYQNIQEVRPGETLVFDLERLTCTPYAQNNFDRFGVPDFAGKTNQEILQQLQSDITAAIDIRLKSEVPVTILASGGVDSSWIAGVAAQGLEAYGNLSLYTCHIMDGKDKANEDLLFARKLASHLKLDLREIKVDPLRGNEFMALSREITRQVELPLNLFLSTIPTYLMTRDMRERGIKVVLDGVGGDEVMGGYPTYESLFHAALNKRRFKAAAHYFIAWLRFQSHPPGEIFRALKSGTKAILTDSGIWSTADHLERAFSPLVLPPHLPREFQAFAKGFMREKMDTLTERQLFEINFYQLPFYLGIADQMSMMNSVENRSPYLDARLHKYIYAPDWLKFLKGFNKYGLRQTMPTNIPDEIRWRKGKVGIGNAYSQSLIDSPEVRDCILGSEFIRATFRLDLLESMFQEGGASRNTVRPLFSLALLDDLYGLSL